MLRIGAIALLLATSCSSERAPSKAQPPNGSPFETFATTSPRAGERAPAFELTDTGGTTTRLSDAIGRGPVVLVFGSFT